MSKASHINFLTKLYDELVTESDTFRKSQVNKRVHTFYSSVEMLKEQTKIELKKRPLKKR